MPPSGHFNKIKQCRRVATRYDKLAANYLAFIQLASIRLWLRVNESTSKVSLIYYLAGNGMNLLSDKLLHDNVVKHRCWEDPSRGAARNVYAKSLK